MFVVTGNVPSDNDVRIAELSRSAARDELIINGARTVLTVVAFAVPLAMLRDIITPFAGVDSGFSFNLGLSGISWTVTGTVSIGWFSQRRTIKQLRERNERLVRMVKEASGESDGSGPAA